MRICLVLEGCYPYVHGGVSTWMHSYIEAMKEHEFVLWVIGAKAEDRGKFVYDLPDLLNRHIAIQKNHVGTRAHHFGHNRFGRVEHVEIGRAHV